MTVAFYGDLFRKDPERGYDPQFDLKELLTKASGVFQAGDHDVDLDELVKMLADQHLDRLLAQAAAYLENRHDPARAPDPRRGAPSAPTPRSWWPTRSATWSPTRRSPATPNGTWPGSSPWARRSVANGILSLLEPGPVAGRGGSPAGTSQWVNIRNADDPACIRPLPEAFEGPVIERLVDNGHRVHDPEPYLNNPTTGGAIAAMLTPGS